MRTCWTFCHLYLTYACPLRANVLMQTERLYMTLYMCFIDTLVMACTVSEKLAQIDHQIGHLWPWKWPFEWIHTFYILGQDWLHTKEATRCIKLGQLFVISIRMGKLAKPENSSSNYPNLTVFWHFETRKRTFRAIQLLKGKWAKFDLSDLYKGLLGRFNHIHILQYIGTLVPS